MEKFEYTVTINLRAEMKIKAKNCQQAEELARAKLDAFRESVQPSTEYGISLYEDTRTPEEKL